jgi:F1F0 ATPase subunit 2
MEVSPTGGVLLALASGLALGGLYFLGLWATVRRLPTARSPGLLTLASFLARSGLLVGGIVLVAGGHWPRMAAALVGFVVVRAVLVRRWGPAGSRGERA